MPSATSRVSASIRAGNASIASTITRACSVRSTTGGQRLRDQRVLLQCPAQRQVAPGRTAGGAGLDRQPRGRVPQALLLTDLVGGREHPHRERVELRARLGQRDQRGPLLLERS